MSDATQPVIEATGVTVVLGGSPIVRGVDLTTGGTTVLVVLHELGALAPLIGRAVVLRHGAVAHDGAPPPPQAEHADPDHVHLHPHDGDRDPAHDEAGVTPTVRWQR